MTELEVLQAEWRERALHYMHHITEHTFYGTPVGSVLEDALNPSGKMFRLKLLLLCGLLGNRRKEYSERLCMAAAMVELVHLASLIHDDIIDNAPYRRGRPSIQNKYGKKAAVYAGDFIIARINYYAAVNNLNTVGAVLSKAIEAMCSGEIGQAICSYKEDVTIEDYFLNVQGKTAALFKAACSIGASQTGCSDSVVKKLETFGENFGLMFQLRDDLSDFQSSKSVQGKQVHKDFRNGVYTFPVLAAMRNPDGYKTLLPIMRENITRRLTNQEIIEMEEQVIRFGGVEATYKKIKEFAHVNKAILNDLGEDNEAVTLIGMMLQKLEVY